jgi:hypothetical protein
MRYKVEWCNAIETARCGEGALCEEPHARVMLDGEYLFRQSSIAEALEDIATHWRAAVTS